MLKRSMSHTWHAVTTLVSVGSFYFSEVHHGHNIRANKLQTTLFWMETSIALDN
jgi:hypothetical protein